MSDFEEAVDSLRAVFNRVHAAYSNSHMLWSPPGVPGGADALVAHLELATEHLDEQRKHWRA